jgi:hypothetical protein
MPLSPKDVSDKLLLLISKSKLFRETKWSSLNILL